jgi:hypothetical protein
MAHVALLGAGFSRNWGGWLATEVLGELLGRVIGDNETYAKLRRLSNFEDTLAILQTEARTKGSDEAKGRLANFELAVIDTFSEMNEVFAQLPGWGLSNDASDSIDAFLSRFDAIFSLNQDLLLELHYRPEVPGGYSFPGMKVPANWHNLFPQEKLSAIWQPSVEIPFDGPGQPIIKLHGSVNWRDQSGNQLMVMGGAKTEAIEHDPVLNKYHEYFGRMLNRSNSKVMVIGYGFNDSHINDLLVRAGVEHGMQMHLVNPSGLDVFRSMPRATIEPPNPLEDIPLIGVTRRSFRESFSGDKISQKSLLRFFA